MTSSYNPVVKIYAARWLNSCASVSNKIRELIALIDDRIEIKEIFVEDEETVEDDDLKRIKAFPTTQFYEAESETQYFPTDTDDLQPPWNETGLIGVHFEIIENALRAISSSPGLPHHAAQAVQEDPSGSNFPSWEAFINEEGNKRMLEGMNRFDEGLSPANLLCPEYLKYHHRRGLNSYLSENYFSKFIYDGQEWASAQHAYQAAKFNHGDGKHIRKWIQDVAEPQEAMEIARTEEKNQSFKTPGFFEKNREIMFHIALAKFQQNPKLRRWLLETDQDRSQMDSPIFHTDLNDFWGLGPLQEDGRYRGKNWNGKILMLVRRKLRRDFGDRSGRTDTFDLTAPAAARLPRDPFPPLGPPEDDEEQGAVMRRSLKYLRASMRSFKLVPLAKGALIAQRYRVLHHVNTGGLGSFVGEHCYVCEDTELFTDSLDRRLQRLIRKSDAWGGLRRQLIELQKALSNYAVGSSQETFKELWKGVDAQVRAVRERLYQCSDGDDVFQALVALLGNLVSKHPGSEAWGLDRIQARPLEGAVAGSDSESGDVRVQLARSAFRLETLLEESDSASSLPLIFLKTFKSVDDMKEGEAAKAKAQKAMIREIRVCSTEQPDLSHPNVCGISLATHAAAVEVDLKGFGHVGLRGRLPFVALEYCNGPDLWDVFTHGVKNSSGAWAESPGVWALSKRLKRKLADVSTGCSAIRPSVNEDDDLLRVNQLLDAAAAYQSELGVLFLNVLKNLVGDGDLERCRHYANEWSKKYERDIKMDRALFSVHSDVKAGRALRRLLELVQNGEWVAVKDFLRLVKPPDSKTIADVTDEQLIKLEAMAAKHHAACNTMYRRMGVVLLGEKIFSHAAFNPRSEASYSLQMESESLAKRSRTEGDAAPETLDKQQLAMLNFENVLFQHVVTASGKERLALHGAVRDSAASCPPHVAIEIFRQAAEAIAKLHTNNIVHGDIKAENFVLTDEEQVKLIDFGFLVEIDLLKPEKFGPADVLNADYIAPEMREIKFGRLNLARLLEEGLVASLGDLLKANDIWMLGQILYYLLCRPKEVESSKFFADKYAWRDQDGWEITSGLNADQATRRLETLGLQSDLIEKLRNLLFGKMLVPVQNRCKVVQELAQEAAQLGKDMLQRGQAGLLQVVWPYFIPNAGISAHLLREKARGDCALKQGKPTTLFEPDVQYVKVTGGKLHWRVFEVGRGLQTDGVELQVGDIIEQIDGKGPKECSTKRSGPYNSEIRLTIKASGDAGAARELVLRRIRPVKRDTVAPDAERFRRHLVETGYWQRAPSDDFHRGNIEEELNRWRQQYKSDIDVETLIFAWRRRGWLSTPAGQDQRPTYHPRIRTIS